MTTTTPTTTTTSIPAETYWHEVDSPVGPLLLTAGSDGALTSLSVPGQKGGQASGTGGGTTPGPSGWPRNSSAPTSPGS